MNRAARIIRTDNLSLAHEICSLDLQVGTLLDALQAQIGINHELVMRLNDLEDKLNGLPRNEQGSVLPGSESPPSRSNTDRIASELGDLPRAGTGRNPYGL